MPSTSHPRLSSNHYNPRYDADTDGTVDALDTDSVGAAQIAADAVGASEIAAGAVGTAEIAAAAVTASEIAAGAVTDPALSDAWETGTFTHGQGPNSTDIVFASVYDPDAVLVVAGHTNDPGDRTFTKRVGVLDHNVNLDGNVIGATISWSGEYNGSHRVWWFVWGMLA